MVSRRRNGDYNDLMKRDVTTLLREALRLSAQDRAALAEALLASLDEDVDDDAGAAWRSEIERRIAELDSGSVASIPWHVVRQRLFERARRRALRRLHDGLNLQWTPQRSRDALHER
jgi:putative addiction module component (TIGR02574 family)